MTEQEIRSECARIASIEAGYWASVESESVREYSIGAMGAASNIFAAILMGKTSEQYLKEVAARDTSNLRKEETPMPTISTTLATVIEDLEPVQTAFQRLLSSLPDGVKDLDTIQAITTQLQEFATKYANN